MKEHTFDLETSYIRIPPSAEDQKYARINGERLKEHVRALGASEIIDRSQGRLWPEAEAHAPAGYDVVFDANGVDTLGQSLEHLAPMGRLVVYGFASMLPRANRRMSWLRLAWHWLRTPRISPFDLTDRGVAKERIHIERFLAGRPSAALAAQMAQLQEKAAGLTISVTLDGRTRKVEFTEANILDSAREAGLPAPFACKAGVCATCRAKVTRGKVEMAARYGLTDEEIAAGYVLTCQSVPVGEGVAVDYDA